MGLRGRWISMIVLAGCLALPASAGADTDPRDDVNGVPAGADWFDGSAIQQPGQNCSTLGEPQTEIMINGYGSYGGVDGFVQVGDDYWASLLVGVPGNPCGSGSSSVATDLKMPHSTSYDPSRQIQCFGTNRFSDNFFEVTNQTWNFLGHSGRYCPTGASSPASGIGQGFGFRPLANGQLFWIFVPVKSTAEIHGAGEPGETGEFNWLTTASAAYANPYRSYTWVNVLAAGSPPSPFFWFSRNPSADPFWDTSAASGEENRAEFWANLNSANEPGFLCFHIYRVSDNNDLANCSMDPGWNGNVPNTGNPLWQVYATPPDAGPNGGYVPFFYGPLFWGVPLKIVWDFNPNSGPDVFSAPQNFTPLSGPDLDDDGVADSADACDGVQGTLPNGCLPTPKMDGSTAVKRGAKIKRRGQSIGIECNILATATAKLTIKRGLARNLGVISAAGVRIGGGKATCKPAGDNKLKLKLTPKAKRKLARPGKEKATLTITFKAGSKTDKVVVPVKIA